MVAETLPVEQYEPQLEAKRARLTALLAPFNAPPPAIFRSPVSHYRMRAEFRIWHEGDTLSHVMFDKKDHTLIKLSRFPVASQLINQLMPEVIAGVTAQPLLKQKLFQVDYLTTTSGQALITLLYHRPLDAAWQQHALILRDSLRAKGFQVHLIGRARKTKICLDQDYVDEVFQLEDRTLTYRQVENSFTQPNAAISRQMLNWVRKETQQAEGDLLELYCGNGNFSLALAQNFRQVLATEIAAPSVAAAQYNIAVNQIDNVQILRMSAEELTQAMQGVRAFRRLEGIDLTRYQFTTLLVDPPRSGLDAGTLQLAQGFDHIIYISCNPVTLCQNLTTLCQTHQLTRLALFDQFPYTDHIECGVILSRKKAQ